MADRLTNAHPVTAGDRPGRVEIRSLSHARWLPGEQAPAALPGFVGSSFSPLAAAVAEQCLRRHHGERPLDPVLGERTGLLLASVRGDVGIARAIAASVDAGRRTSPLLFFQASPNAVLGYIAARWGITGPVVCVSPVGDAETDALASGAALIRDGDADAALVIVVEQAWHAGENDSAAATLVCRADRDYA